MNTRQILLICITIIIIVAMPVGCSIIETRTVAEAVKESSDPIATRCTILGSSDSTRNMCLVNAAKNK